MDPPGTVNLFHPTFVEVADQTVNTADDFGEAFGDLAEPTAGIEPATYSLFTFPRFFNVFAGLLGDLDGFIRRGCERFLGLVDACFSGRAGVLGVSGICGGAGFGVWAWWVEFLGELSFRVAILDSVCTESFISGVKWQSELAVWERFMRSNGLAERTISERVRVVNQVAVDTGLDPCLLSVSDVSAWVSLRGSATSKQCAASHLRQWFRFLVLMGVRVDNPVNDIRPKRPRSSRPRPVPPDVVAQVLAKKLRVRTRAMISLAFYEGLRVHEIAKVRGSDFDVSAGLFRVVGKGGYEGLIPIHPKVLELVPYFPRGWWFPSWVNQGHVTSRAVGEIIKQQFLSVGYSMTAHQLRHSFGTELVAAGVDIRLVQELMRHQSLQTTALYTAVSSRALSAAMGRLALPVVKEDKSMIKEDENASDDGDVV